MTKQGIQGETGLCLSVSLSNGTVIIELQGNFDIFSDDAFRARVRELVRGGAQSFIIDLSKTAYVDESGVSALVDMADFVKRSGKTISTIAGSARTRKLFAVLGLDHNLTMIGSPHPKR